MSTFKNRILIAIAASAVLALAGPVALTAVSPAAYADDGSSSADGMGDSADAGHDKGDNKGDSKGDKGQSKGDGKGGESGYSKGGDSGHSSGHGVAGHR